MKGVSYITDNHNHKTAIVIDIKTLYKYQDEVEDLLAGLIAESRRDEPKIPISKVIKNFKKTGKL
jgi:hypothetical protein